ncbi:hypothetical protein M407DRAFT_243168 [Tulasnella calospora MUT 4182]|uniref:Uncharacterized protein n=1 Tax=Tulasnella calospora MUT 4182 TaxID=1051891 RepID=A0A0C3QBX8_9AGAM|nr:hypothetical protein M407DRAFT_243168 [Tulasnella calospora MUT 4182]
MKSVGRDTKSKAIHNKDHKLQYLPRPFGPQCRTPFSAISINKAITLLRPGISVSEVKRVQQCAILAQPEAWSADRSGPERANTEVEREKVYERGRWSITKY